MSVMAIEKKQLGFEDIEAQTALELPDRETMLVTVVITNLLNNLSISIPVQNNNVAVQVCAIVSVLDTILLPAEDLTCEIDQS
jgi:hypothetical protein